LPEESEKALGVDVLPREVAPPPGLSSPGSGLVKSVVGVMRLALAVSSPWLWSAPAKSGKAAPNATIARRKARCACHDEAFKNSRWARLRELE
jgi:hypothetical protein